MRNISAVWGESLRISEECAILRKYFLIIALFLLAVISECAGPKRVSRGCWLGALRPFILPVTFLKEKGKDINMRRIQCSIRLIFSIRRLKSKKAYIDKQLTARF